MVMEKISSILSNSANLVTVLTGIKDFVPIVTGTTGLLSLVQTVFSDYWIKIIIAIIQVIFMVVLYLYCKSFNKERISYKQEIERLKTELSSNETSYKQQLEELKVELQNKRSMDSCIFDARELETYDKCNKKSKNVSFPALVELKNKFLACSKDFREKADNTIKCLNKLSPKDRSCLVYVDFTREDDKLAKDIYALLHDNSFNSTSSLITGDDVEMISSHDVIVKACGWVIVLYHESNNFETVSERLKKYKKFRRCHNIRILVCSSKLQHDQVKAYIDDENDLISPESYNTSILDRLRAK